MSCRNVAEAVAIAHIRFGMALTARPQAILVPVCDGAPLCSHCPWRAADGRTGAMRVSSASPNPNRLRKKVSGERVVYDNLWVRLALVDIELPERYRFEHHVVRLQRVAIAVVLNDADEELMLWRRTRRGSGPGHFLRQAEPDGTQNLAFGALASGNTY
jgi:hypothetical protein